MAASTAFSLSSSDSFKMPSEPCPLPSMGSDEESFVVLGKSLTSDFDESPNEENKDPVGASIVQEAQQLISKELSQMDESTILPAMPQVQKKFNTDALICSIASITGDLSSEEVQNKISQIIEENICLKDTILQNNMSMKSQYERIVAWQADVEKVHKAHKEKFMEAKDYIEMLKQENYNFKQELHKYKQQVEEQNNERKKVYEELNTLRNTLKDKARFANEKLVKSSDNNLKEFELDVANKKVKDLENALANLTLEHTNFKADKNPFNQGELDAANNKIKELETALDNLRLENSKLKEDNVQFNESNDKLQKTEKQIEALNSEISALKLQNEEAKLEIFKVKSVETEKQKYLAEQLNSVKSELHNLQQRSSMVPTHEELAHIRQQLMNSQVALTQSEQARSEAHAHIQTLNVEICTLKNQAEGRNASKDDMFALQTQLEVYKSDFDAERNAKEAIKTEKDKLSEDLQHLQRRNQQLQEEIELLREHGEIVHVNHVTSSGPRPSSSSSSSGNSTYTCPKCNFAFHSIQTLENHVYRCIELDDHLP